MIEKTTGAVGAAAAGFPAGGDRTALPKGIVRASGYIANLDGIRGTAVLLVLASHSLGLFGGMLGVDVFFVLSGFLITNLLLAEQESNTSLAVFYWRRFLRLMPALAVVALAVFLVAPFLPGVPSRSCEALAPLLGVANWTTPFGAGCPKYMGHAWSLSIEEQFYLLWPMLLLATLRFGGRRAALILAVALATGCGLWRAYLALHGAPITRIYWPFDTRCDGLLIGAAAALAQRGAGADALYRAARALWVPAALGLALIIALASNHMPFFEGGYIVVAVLSMIVIVAASRVESGVLDRLIGAEPLVYLGTLSYGFYLWHYPIAVLAGRWEVSGTVKFFAIGFASLVAAYLSRRFVEVPMLRLRPAVSRHPWLGWLAVCVSVISLALGLLIYMPR
jgi:peptidoglycan/LPS O-acetylase OafA/YrhL